MLTFGHLDGQHGFDVRAIMHRRKLSGTCARGLMALQAGNFCCLDRFEHGGQTRNPLWMSRTGIVFKTGWVSDKRDGHGGSDWRKGSFALALMRRKVSHGLKQAGAER
jgi:hypothetical protein